MTENPKSNKFMWAVSSRGPHKDVSVAEDWSPTVDGLLHVAIYFWEDDLAKVVACGDDDTVMAGYFTHEKAQWVFGRINHLVTKADLRSLGLEFD